MSALRIPCVSEVASTSPRCIPQLAARRSLSRRAGRRATTQVLNCAVNPRSTPSINVAAALEAPTASRLASPAGVAPAAGSGGFNSDILGLGQAIVDWSASVDFSLLSTFNVPLGGRRVITVEERASVMETLDEIGAPSQVSAGGSLANTLVGVARLARAAGKDLRVALGGSLGTDTLGQYFNSQLRSAGVRCLLDTHQHHAAQHALHPQPHDQHPQPTHPTQQPQQQPAHSAQQQHPSPEGHTGTVMVLTTPDAQRSFLSFFTSDRLALSERLRSAVRGCRLVVMEGYLWEMEGAEAYMAEVIRIAHAAGAQVAMTAGDPGVVARHREEMLRTIARGVDMVFTNEDEAANLVGLPGPAALASSPTASEEELEEAGERAALALAELCPVAVVTAGSKGSYVCAMGEIHAVPPYWLPQGPVDTCGAGDAYMAGFTYAMMAGYDARTAGEFASRVASAVIGRYGPHLSDEDAEDLVGQLPEHTGPMRVALGGAAGQLELGGGAGGFSF